MFRVFAAPAKLEKTAAVSEHRTSWPTVTITTSSDESDQACECVSVMEAELEGGYSTGNGYCELCGGRLCRGAGVCVEGVAGELEVGWITGEVADVPAVRTSV